MCCAVTLLCRHKQSSAGTLAVEEPEGAWRWLWVSSCPLCPQGHREAGTDTKSRLRAHEASELMKAFQISPKVSLFHQVKHIVSGLEHIISWASLLNQLGLEGLSSTFRGA